MKDLVSLLFIFFKISFMTFGGGYGMLPILHKELVERHKWVNSQELLDYFAIGQCTPGIIAINTSTLIGYKRHGVLGSLAATLGFILPSFLVITVLASVIRDISHMAVVEHAFSGVRVAVVALVLVAISKLWKGGIKDGICFLIFFFVLLLSIFSNISPVYIVLAVLVVGFFLKRGEYPVQNPKPDSCHNTLHGEENRSDKK